MTFSTALEDRRSPWPPGGQRSSAPTLTPLAADRELPAGPWLRALARHVAQARLDHPEDELLVLFDVDGTLLDFRAGLVDLLERFDEEHGSTLFTGVRLDEVRLEEAHLRRLFEARGVPYHLRRELLARAERLGWSPRAVLGAHQPFLGMLEILRWFQSQPQVHVAFITERPEERREETIQALSTLGATYGLRFPEDLLFTAGSIGGPGAEIAAAEATSLGTVTAAGVGALPAAAAGESIPEQGRPMVKQDGVRHFQRRGFRVVAVVDDRADHLEAIRRDLGRPDLLLLQTKGLTISLPSLAQRRGEAAVPQVVWRGLEDLAALGQFLGSPLQWAELPLERSAAGELVVSRRRSQGRPLVLEEILGSFAQCGKGLRLQLVEGGALLSRTLFALRQSGFPAERIHFVLAPDTLGRAGFQRVMEELPGAVRIVPLGFLSVVAAIAPDQARAVLQQLRSWAVERVTVALADPHLKILEQLAQEAGFAVELDAGEDLADYICALSSAPRAVISEFGCEHWRLKL
jgi:hypothetical protein